MIDEQCKPNVSYDVRKATYSLTSSCRGRGQPLPHHGLGGSTTSTA